MGVMRTTRGTWVGAALLALLVAACDGGGDTTASGGSGGTTGSAGGGGAGGGAAPSCEGQPEKLDVAGTWAAYGALTATITGQAGSLVSICPADQEGQAFMMLVVTIGQDQTTLKDVKAVLCSVELPAVTAIAGKCEPGTEAAVTTQISAPKALSDALPGLSPAPVGGTLSGEAPGSEIALERFTVTAGSSKTGADLPLWDTDAAGCDAGDVGHSNQCEAACVSDCAALRDDDGDTYPGITLDVCGRSQDDEGKPCNTEDPAEPGVTIQGRAFAALEVDPQFTGIAKSSCELAGNVSTGVRYTVVGADITLTGGQIAVGAAIDALPTLEVLTGQSKLTMVRVDGKYGTPDLDLGALDALAACELVIEKKNELF